MNAGDRVVACLVCSTLQTLISFNINPTCQACSFTSLRASTLPFQSLSLVNIFSSDPITTYHLHIISRHRLCQVTRRKSIMLSILQFLPSVAVLILSFLALHPSKTLAFAVPTLKTRYVPPFSGHGNLVVRQGTMNNGCITTDGKWTIGGQCAVFSAASQGGVATQLTSSIGQCGLDATFELVCEVGNPNGPENWHVSVLMLPLLLSLALLASPVLVEINCAKRRINLGSAFKKHEVGL